MYYIDNNRFRQQLTQIIKQGQDVKREREWLKQKQDVFESDEYEVDNVDCGCFSTGVQVYLIKLRVLEFSWAEMS